MKPLEWKTYRTRFLIKAKQLSSSLSFVDHLGRQHCGRKGDYLVESSDGVLSIAPRRIFEDIYVPMSLSKSQASDGPSSAAMWGGHSCPPASAGRSAPSNEPATSERSRNEPGLDNSIPGRPKFVIPKFQTNSETKSEMIFEPLEIEAVKLRPASAHSPLAQARSARDEPARVRRKLPQPCRDRSPSGPRLRLM